MKDKELQEEVTVADITPDMLKAVSPTRLAIIHKFLQGQWEKVKTGEANREDVINAYLFLLDEIDSRGIKVDSDTELDQAAAAFKSTVKEALSLKDWTLIPDFVSMVGSSVTDPEQANDRDFVVRLEKTKSNEDLFQSIGLLLRKQFDPEKTGKDIHILSSPHGPHGDYTPIWDLVLRPRGKADRVRVNQGDIPSSEDVSYHNQDADSKIREIKDAEHYDPATMRDDQLRDDWRIVCGWNATAKDSNKTIKFDMETIEGLGKKILLELLKRKKKDPSVFTASPEDMKDDSREFYNKVAGTLSKEDKAFLETPPEDLKEKEQRDGQEEAKEKQEEQEDPANNGQQEEVTEALKDEDETRSTAAQQHWQDNWWREFPKSGSGSFVFQHHWRGLSEDETKLPELDLLKTTHSVHGDLRLSFGAALFGWTIFLGTTEQVKDGRDLFSLKGEDKLRCTPKLTQPSPWLRIGSGKGTIMAPGDAGSTTNKYAKFFRIDRGTWRMGTWREHSFELFLSGSKLKGRYLIQFAPVGEGGRVWLIYAPTNQTPYSQSHNLDSVIKELQSKGQKHLIWTEDQTPKLIDISRTKEAVILPIAGWSEADKEIYASLAEESAVKGINVRVNNNAKFGLIVVLPVSRDAEGIWNKLESGAIKSVALYK
jgi:hypothetical protein